MIHNKNFHEGMSMFGVLLQVGKYSRYKSESNHIQLAKIGELEELSVKSSISEDLALA
jgi:hypothetical protein